MDDFDRLLQALDDADAAHRVTQGKNSSLWGEAASALRACDRDLATARDAVQRIKEAAAALDDECAHIRAEGLLRPSLETLLDVVKLAFVVSPPTSSQEGGE